MHLVKSLSVISFITVAFAMPPVDRETEVKAVAEQLLKDEAGIEAVKALAQAIDESGNAEERGIIGTTLDLLFGTAPDATATPYGMVVHTGQGGQFHQAYPGPTYGGGYNPYNPYNSYNPYNPYNSYNPYNPYNSYGSYY